MKYNIAHIADNKPFEAVFDDGDNSHSAKVYNHGLTRSKDMGINLAVWKHTAYLHDLGKSCANFHGFILDANNYDVGHNFDKFNKNHVIAGCSLVFDYKIQPTIKFAMSFAIHAHHIGLTSMVDMISDVRDFRTPVKGHQPSLEFEDIKALPPIGADALTGNMSNQLNARMLSSLLVYADHRATAEFYDDAPPPTIRHSWDHLISKYEDYTSNYEADGVINSARKHITELCMEQAHMDNKRLIIEAPTGSGKTIASLGLALHRAKKLGHDKIIYVIPFNAITEQVSEQFREIFGNDVSIMHHYTTSKADKFKYKSYTSVWDAQIIITTYVQFFDSLFATQTRQFKKLQAIPNSCIILDEIQGIEPSKLYPCIGVLEALTVDWKCSVVTMSATHLQHPLNTSKHAWVNVIPRDLITSYTDLFNKRSKCFRPQTLWDIDFEVLVDHAVSKNKQTLIICNRKDDTAFVAHTLISRGIENIFHLSTNMTHPHRQLVLKTVRKLLSDKQPVVLVSTSLIEAGVDVSFELVYREREGMVSLAQANGRCNRHGECDNGEMYAFNLTCMSEGRGYEAKRAEYYSYVCNIVGNSDQWFTTKNIAKYFERYYGEFGGGVAPFGEGNFIKHFPDDNCYNYNFMDYNFAMIADKSTPVIINNKRVLGDYQTLGERMVDDWKLLNHAIKNHSISLRDNVIDDLVEGGFIHQPDPDLEVYAVNNEYVDYYDEMYGLFVTRLIDRDNSKFIIDRLEMADIIPTNATRNKLIT